MFNNRDKKEELYTISLISNISFEPHFDPLLQNYFNKDNTQVEVNFISNDECITDDNRSKLIESELLIVWLDIETLLPNAFVPGSSELSKDNMMNNIVAFCQRLYTYLSGCSSSRILWFLFEDYYVLNSITIGHRYNPFVDTLNLKLCELIKDKIAWIDLKNLVAEVGLSNAYDPKGKYRWNAPYSKSLIEVAIKEIYKQCLIEAGITKKCLILDCDNVLWGGILSEDGIENIKLGSGFGRAYQDFQRFILSLYYHGVILAVCSKNDLSDVMTMFRTHSEMIIKEEHIACFQVNWENKPDNIKKIVETLNISMDSMVFIDDSPIEIEAVRSLLPDITTILYERDTVYKHFSLFNLKNSISIDDIKRRNDTYHTNQAREVLKSKYKDYSDFIAALNIRIDIHKAAPIEYSRISELTQRTNKCTNGKRYTVNQIKERAETDNISLYVLSVSDRFSDLGIVGAFEIKGNSLTLFSVSCRALGRGIESKLIEFITNNYQITNIVFHYTGKNEDIEALLQKAFPNAAVVTNEI